MSSNVFKMENICKFSSFVYVFKIQEFYFKTAVVGIPELEKDFIYLNLIPLFEQWKKGQRWKNKNCFMSYYLYSGIVVPVPIGTSPVIVGRTLRDTPFIFFVFRLLSKNASPDSIILCSSQKHTRDWPMA